jgi:hypothetical protein
MKNEMKSHLEALQEGMKATQQNLILQQQQSTYGKGFFNPG